MHEVRSRAHLEGSTRGAHLEGSTRGAAAARSKPGLSPASCALSPCVRPGPPFVLQALVETNVALSGTPGLNAGVQGASAVAGGLGSSPGSAGPRGSQGEEGAGLRVVALGASFGPSLPRTQEEALRMPLALLPDTPTPPPHFAAPVPSSPWAGGQPDSQSGGLPGVSLACPAPSEPAFQVRHEGAGLTRRTQSGRARPGLMASEPGCAAPGCLAAVRLSGVKVHCGEGPINLLACPPCHERRGLPSLPAWW